MDRLSFEAFLLCLKYREISHNNKIDDFVNTRVFFYLTANK